jgi:hypothetical protein
MQAKKQTEENIRPLFYSNGLAILPVMICSQLEKNRPLFQDNHNQGVFD